MRSFLAAISISYIIIVAQTAYHQRPCQRILYCNSKLLHHVQMSQIFPNCKTFMDYHLKYPESDILRSFETLLNQTKNEPDQEHLRKFVKMNFDTTNELTDWMPPDYNANTSFLNIINDEELRKFGKEIHSMWPSLGRKLKPMVVKTPELSSAVTIPSGYITSGKNDNELRYWDSYWIIQGLLLNGMTETAKGILSNLIAMQQIFGHIPKASKWYYQERSQPPLLSAMMSTYLQATDDIEFLKDNVAAIEDELEYWYETHKVELNVDDRVFEFIQYHSPSRGPRAEEYYRDFTSAQELDTDEDKDRFYTNIKSAGESGWDITHRWNLTDNLPSNDNSVNVTDIIPVDLNAIFANSLQNLATFHFILGNLRASDHWAYFARIWMIGIQDVLWNEEDGMWYDWDLSSGTHRKHFYYGNLSPLWMSVVRADFIHFKAENILEYLKKSYSFQNFNGSSISKRNDTYGFLNIHPTFVSVVVSSLESIQTQDSVRAAFNIAQDWVRSAYNDNLKNQTTESRRINNGLFNGVLLEMLAKYGPTLKADEVTEENQETASNVSYDQDTSDDFYDVMLLDS